MGRTHRSCATNFLRAPELQHLQRSRYVKCGSCRIKPIGKLCVHFRLTAGTWAHGFTLPDTPFHTKVTFRAIEFEFEFRDRVRAINSKLSDLRPSEAKKWAGNCVRRHTKLSSDTKRLTEFHHWQPPHWRPVRNLQITLAVLYHPIDNGERRKIFFILEKN